PLRLVLNQPFQFFSQLADWRLIIQTENYCSQQIGRDPAPILKRLLDEVGNRQNQPSKVPCPHGYVAECDLFNLTKLAFDYHNIIDEQRLSQRDLNTRKNVSECFLRGKTDHDPRDSGGSENAGAELPHRIEELQ